MTTTFVRSGGASLGASQVGMLQVLEQEGMNGRWPGPPGGLCTI